MYIVAKIHNNSLVKATLINWEDKAIEKLKQWAVDQLMRDLTPEEIEGIENDLEYFNEDDLDNIYCFSVIEPTAE